MDRRRYLGIVGTIVTGPLAGCNSNTEDNSPSNTSELSVGDSAIKDGTFRITVLKTRRLSQLDDEYGTTTPSPQAAFFAIKIRAEHIGETEEDYPETDTIGAVNLFYLEEEVRSFSTPQTFQDSRGKEYTTYRSIIFDRGYDTGAFPDTSVTGWVVYELPDGFEPEEMTLKVRQGSGEDLVWRFR